MPTKTVDEARQAALAARNEAECMLEQLEEKRQAIAPEAVGGDQAATQELERIERETRQASRTRALADAALAELDEREKEAAKRAETEHREELGQEFDRLVKERKKQLRAFEKALDGLKSAYDAVLEVDTQQRRIGAEIGLVGDSIASYDHTLRNRILTRFSDLLRTGPSTRYLDPLTEDVGVFSRTLKESEAIKAETSKRAEQRKAEEARVRAAVERAEKISHRRDALRARMGYDDALPARRAEIEAQVEAWLREEFPQDEEV